MRKPPPLPPPGSRRPDDGVLVHMSDVLVHRLEQPILASEGQAVPPMASDGSAAVLAFPAHSEALLASLVPTLRSIYVHGDSERDPFLMTMSRGPRPCLSIDRDAYVEIQHQPEAFLLKIAAAPDSKITFETPDFAMLVKFVLQYLAERHGDPGTDGGSP